MSYRTCPDWPQLMELAPELQFKHMTVAEAHLPVDVLTRITHVSLDEVEICCDVDHHVVNANPLVRGGRMDHLWARGRPLSRRLTCLGAGRSRPAEPASATG